MARVVVVGAGISGMAFAYRFRQLQPAAEVALLEADSRPGGKVWTERTEGFQVECGPNGFLDSKPSTLLLCRDLGLGGELVSASEASRRNRYVFLRERLHKLPGGPLGLLTTPLLSLGGKLALLAEPFRRSRPIGDETVADFFRRRMGQEAADVLGDALVTGIHGGDPALLSMPAAFPRVAEIEAAHGSVIRGFLRVAKQKRRDAKSRGEPPPKTGRMWSFRGGLRRLIEALAERLPAPLYGVRVRRVERGEPAALVDGAGCGAGFQPAGSMAGWKPAPHSWIVRGEGREAWPADAVVLACPAAQQAEILADLDPPLAAEIAGIASNRIAVVAVGFRQGDVPRPPDGFGFIAPQHTRRDVLGVQWCSAIYPDRAPPGFVLWRALCGGWHRADVVDWPDDQLLAAVLAELRLAHGVTAAPAFHHIARWSPAIPQYHVGHLNRVTRIEALAARHPGLVLTGNAYRGVALNDCTEQASILATRLAEGFASGPAGR